MVSYGVSLHRSDRRGHRIVKMQVCSALLPVALELLVPQVLPLGFVVLLAIPIPLVSMGLTLGLQDQLALPESLQQALLVSLAMVSHPEAVRQIQHGSWH